MGNSPRYRNTPHLWEVESKKQILENISPPCLAILAAQCFFYSRFFTYLCYSCFVAVMPSEASTLASLHVFTSSFLAIFPLREPSFSISAQAKYQPFHLPGQEHGL